MGKALTMGLAPSPRGVGVARCLGGAPRGDRFPRSLWRAASPLGWRMREVSESTGRKCPGPETTSDDTTMDREGVSGPPRICVIGPGTRFLSGVSYYTHQLATALARSSHPVSVLLLRQLLPTRLYPGARRVGASLSTMAYPTHIPVYDGVDWYWLPSMLGALRFLRRQRPRVVLLQWWTGTVLHSYLLLALAARLLGARVIVEFHEVLDISELTMPAARAYVRWVAPLVLRLAQGYITHSAFDTAALEAHYHLGRYQRPIVVVPHGPYAQHQGRDGGAVSTSISASAPAPAGAAETPLCRLLYFGVIRPYKGTDDLLRAFEALPPEVAARYHLTIAGETWQGWRLPAELIARSRYRDRIRFINRYVSDTEVGDLFAEADAVVLPYHRSSASGPLQIAMSHGLPVVVTRVGGLTEAVEGYDGAILVPPHDPDALRSALLRVAGRRGERYPDPHSWDTSVARLGALWRQLLDGATLEAGNAERGREHGPQSGGLSTLPVAPGERS